MYHHACSTKEYCVSNNGSAFRAKVLIALILTGKNGSFETITCIT